MAVTGQGRTKSVTVVPQTSTPLYDAFSFDLTTSMSISYPGQAFRHPIQTGAEGITDAVHLEPPEVSVSGIIANTPITPLAGFLPFSIQEAAGDRMISLLELLLKIREAKVLVTVLCSWLRPLENRWIEVIDAERSKESGNSIGVTARFVKMRLVTSQVVPSLIDSDILALGNTTIDIGQISTG